MDFNEIILSDSSDDDIDENVSVNFLTREQAKIAGNEYLNYSSYIYESDYSYTEINDIN